MDLHYLQKLSLVPLYQPLVVLFGAASAVLKTVRAAIDASSQQQDGLIVDSLVADVPQLVAVEEEACTVKCILRGYQVRVGKNLRLAQPLSERLVVALARKLQRTTATSS